MRRIILYLIIILSFATFVFSSEINPPKRGYFQNSNGIKCWYKTSFENSKYFSLWKQRVCVHSFESDTMMTNDDISKRLIANVISRFYIGTKFQNDTKFNTDPEDWKKAEGYQKKGFCIESSNYPIPKIWIDFEYSKDKKYIIKVFHTDGF
ncbi:MAG: hypothetical protein ACTSPW_11080 [Promethearchaeota archaeon]